MADGKSCEHDDLPDRYHSYLYFLRIWPKKDEVSGLFGIN
jgi:hypothetical protein